MFFRYFFFFGILIVFIGIRMLGIDVPYHQDESKYVESFGIYREAQGVNSPHPPLTQAFFAFGADIFGYEYFRVLPLCVSVLNFLLLFFVVRTRWGFQAALWSVFFFTTSFYSVLGSLMIDTDGALLPFFLLLSLATFAQLERTKEGRDKMVWGTLFAISLMLGMLTKLSFILVLIAYAAEFLWRFRANWRPFIRWTGFALFLLGFILFVFWKTKVVGASYDITRTLSHVFDHIRFDGRNYLQILIQYMKAGMYLSPLVLSGFLLSSSRIREVRILLFFVAGGLLFYGVVFDFSSAALDKYLQFLIIPTVIFAGIAVSDEITERTTQAISWKHMLALLTPIGLLLTLAVILSHGTPPLYPKEEWITRILNLRWNFLFPFTGGSGPLGFYMSWFFIAVSWLLGGIAIICTFVSRWRFLAIIFLLLVSCVYNAFFVEEYLLGYAYGSSKTLIQHAVGYLETSNIPSVITYNDVGGSLLRQIKKYERRLYAAPKFEPEYVEILGEFPGHYLVVDIPHLNQQSLFGRYFTTCSVVYQEYSGYISSTIYDCTKAVVPQLL